ncbi:MAG: diaminopimelate epimerase [Actinobacteria bacterium]|nr:diaminopimelate epimerase [Actinomycetota bacterium]
MQFYKYHGTGNDFIVLDAMEEGVFLSPREIEALCQRHTGIGADGVIFACPPLAADAAMRIFNADGSEAEMCGNGIRCLAKYLFERMGIKREDMFIETGGGTRRLRLETVEGLVREVRVDMGLPELMGRDLPAPDDNSRPGEVTITTAGGEVFHAFCLSMGNPHCVLFIEDTEMADLARIGTLLERHELFPNRTNVEFAQVLDERHILLRVWERGVGETQACGTGACAAAVAALHNGGCAAPVEVRLRGGALEIDLDDQGHVYLSGPAVEVFHGEL